MLIVSILAFFVLTFLLASIAVAISWMAFLKTKAEESEAEQGELDAGEDARPLIRTERLSTINFWDNVLAQFDFMEIMKKRIAQADLNWSVGRVTIAMALAGIVAFVIFYRFLGFLPAAVAGILTAWAPYGYILHLRN
jgi:Flp pilus assembly protein TadB